MKSAYIPFFAFFVLLLLTIPFSFDFGTSVVPGWHTTILPPSFIWGFILVIVLLLVTIGYWLLSKRVDKVNWVLFAFHFILTIPMVLFLKFPSILLNIQGRDQQEILNAISFRMKLIPFGWAIFIAGQIIFFVYFSRTISAKKATT